MLDASLKRTAKYAASIVRGRVRSYAMYPLNPFPGESPDHRQQRWDQDQPPKDGLGIYWAFGTIAAAIVILALVAST